MHLYLEINRTPITTMEICHIKAIMTQNNQIRIIILVTSLTKTIILVEINQTKVTPLQENNLIKVMLLLEISQIKATIQLEIFQIKVIMTAIAYPKTYLDKLNQSLFKIKDQACNGNHNSKNQTKS